MHVSRLAFVAAVLVPHVVALSWSAWRHSPTVNEMGHLPAGIANLRHQMFHLYRVNPPLPRMVGAAAVLPFRPKTDWTNYQMHQRAREEIPMGIRFATANGPRTLTLFAIARFACIPFSLLGAIACYLWGTSIWGEGAARAALICWSANPMVLGHGSLLMPDVPAAACGVLASFLAWRWLETGTLRRALAAGIALGVAALCKFTLLVLFPVVLSWAAFEAIRRNRTWSSRGALLAQALILITISGYVVNLGYAFTDSCLPLGTFDFQSRLFSGSAPDCPSTNRFHGTALANLPIPIPRDYLLGIDRQRTDFENGERSYFMGEWKDGGWWYYHIAGLFLKTPVGLLVLLGLVAAETVSRAGAWTAPEAYLLLTGGSILALVSSQTGFSNHVRYSLPALPFAFIWCGKLFQQWSISGPRLVRTFALLAMVIESFAVFPHSASFFNVLVGGPREGHHFLLESNIAWGQDLRFLKDWTETHPEAKPLYIAQFGWIDPSFVGVHYHVAPRLASGTATKEERISAVPRKSADEGPVPGVYIIDVNVIHGTRWPVAMGRGNGMEMSGQNISYEYLNSVGPCDRIAYSYNVYYIDK